MGCRPLGIQMQTLKRCLSSAKFNLENCFALAFFIQLIEKENDDVTEMKFVNYGVGLHTLNDIIDARSQINASSLSNALPDAFRPPRPLCKKRPCLKE